MFLCIILLFQVAGGGGGGVFGVVWCGVCILWCGMMYDVVA